MVEKEKNLQSLNHIPIDVLFEILVRLPAKSVARFLCVSKLWATMIRGEDFIRSFTSHSSPQKQPRLLFAFIDNIMYNNDIWYFFSKSTHVSTPLLPWDPAPGPPVKPNRFALFWRARTFSYGNRSIFPEHKALMEEPIPKPLVVEEPPDFVSMKVSHMKQLRYQSSSYVQGLMSFLCREEQVIFNPSIGKSMTLPTIKTSGIISQSFLGYDPINAQYKELCFISTNVTRCCEHHQVLTLGAQNCSWRLIQCSTPHYRGESPLCIDGILYYKAFTMNETVGEI